jgi:hypothetical protein
MQPASSLPGLLTWLLTGMACSQSAGHGVRNGCTSAGLPKVLKAVVERLEEEIGS